MSPELSKLIPRSGPTDPVVLNAQTSPAAAVVAPAVGKDSKSARMMALSQQYFMAANMGNREEASTYIVPGE